MKIKQHRQNGNTDHIQTSERDNLPHASTSLDDGQRHSVWKPEHRASVKSVDKADIPKRREQLLNRVWATQQVLKLQSEEDNQQLQSPIFQEGKSSFTGPAVKGAMKIPSITSLPFCDMVSQYATSFDGDDDTKDLSMTTKAKPDAHKALSESEYNKQQSPTFNVPAKPMIPEDIETITDSSL